MTKSQRLIRRLRDECGVALPADAKLRRSYIRDRGKTDGGWLWYLVFGEKNYFPTPKGAMYVGSQFSVSALLRCKHDLQVYKWKISEIEIGCDIDPCKECQIKMR